MRAALSGGVSGRSGASSSSSGVANLFANLNEAGRRHVMIDSTLAELKAEL